jgi:hypothetical protein
VTARRGPHESGAQTSQFGQAAITTVTTFEELKYAWTAGVSHIQVRAHLDATSFPLMASTINGAEFRHILPPQKSSTRSLTVRFLDQTQ